MNPGKLAMEIATAERNRAEAVRRERQDRLHSAAVARRRKAKRGGRR